MSNRNRKSGEKMVSMEIEIPADVDAKLNEYLAKPQAYTIMVDPDTSISVREYAKAVHEGKWPIPKKGLKTPEQMQTLAALFRLADAFTKAMPRCLEDIGTPKPKAPNNIADHARMLLRATRFLQEQFEAFEDIAEQFGRSEAVEDARKAMGDFLSETMNMAEDVDAVASRKHDAAYRVKRDEIADGKPMFTALSAFVEAWMECGDDPKMLAEAETQTV